MTTEVNNALKTLTEKVSELQLIRDKKEEHLKSAKHLEEQEKYLSGTFIPDLMMENGFSSFVTEDGLSVKTVTKLMGSLKAGHREAAEPILIDAGMAAILIKTVAVKDNMDDQGKCLHADAAEKILRDHFDDSNIEISIDCHHMKLKSALKELIASNVTVTVGKLLKYYNNDKGLIVKTFFPEILDKEGGSYLEEDFPRIDTELQLGQILEKVFGVYQVTETEIKEKK